MPDSYRCQKYDFVWIKGLAHSKRSMQTLTLTTNKNNKQVWPGAQPSFLGPFSFSKTTYFSSFLLQLPAASCSHLSPLEVALRKKSNTSICSFLNHSRIFPLHALYSKPYLKLHPGGEGYRDRLQTPGPTEIRTWGQPCQGGALRPLKLKSCLCTGAQR